MRVRPDPARVDLVLACVLMPLAEIQVFTSSSLESRRALAAVAAALVTGSVAVRRRYPAAVGIGVQAVLAAVVEIAHLPAGPVTIGWFCALYALSVWTSTLWFVLGAAFVLVSDVTPGLLVGDSLSQVSGFPVGCVVVMVLVRMVVGDRERRLELAERERDLVAREAVLLERSRIARELHDVIAHHVSTMVVQAGAERRVLAGDQKDTADVLGMIERTGRSALTEMRRLVGMLRDDRPDELSPQPGVDDVPMLVGQLREAGMDVDLQITGERPSLPVGVQLATYRIVQEGLTNALKHARGAPVRVGLDFDPDTVHIDIVDQGEGGLPATKGDGHGLVGMRERVALYGGRIETGRAPSGGFAVRVLLPVR